MDGSNSLALSILGGDVATGPTHVVTGPPAHQPSSVASRILGDFTPPATAEAPPAPDGSMVPAPHSTEVASELSNLLLGQGIDPSDKEALMSLAKNLSGSLSSMSQLAALIGNVVMGAQMSREPHETVGDLNRYMTLSKQLGGI